MLPWKQQKIDLSRGPSTDYTSLREPLPTPPPGKEWKRDSRTREWALVSKHAKNGFFISGGNESHVVEEKGQHTGEFYDPLDNSAPKDKLKSSAPSMFNGQNVVEGIDYVEHTVLPTDTIQGICLCYKINLTKLRQANRFSGSNLSIAPPKLVIPLQGHPAIESIRMQDRNSKEFKIQSFALEYPSLKEKEIKAYLELSDWDFENALDDAREDLRWERSNTGLWSFSKNATLSESIKTSDINGGTLNVHVAIPVDVSSSPDDEDNSGEQGVAQTVPHSELEMKSLMSPLLS